MKFSKLTSNKNQCHLLWEVTLFEERSMLKLTKNRKERCSDSRNPIRLRKGRNALETVKIPLLQITSFKFISRNGQKKSSKFTSKIGHHQN